MPSDSTITDAVKSHYASIAKGQGSCCNPKSSCCSDAVTDISTGYTAAELASLPEGANLGLGCGNPIALAGLREGETVVDLGSGAGIDCFLAAQKVGAQGHVIGIDMTEAMIAKARANATQGGHKNVEFRLGEIAQMPLDSGSVDVVISNCVINLVPDKLVVFREIFRVLRPGGHFTVSDIVSKGMIPPGEREDMEKWAGCIAGALPRDEYLRLVGRAGFTDIEVKAEVEYDYKKSDSYALASITVSARKP
jgi:SAM-dependent methyltransferase